MRKIIVTEFVSLDGVFEAPGPDGSTKFAGWTFAYNNAEFAKYKMDELMAAEAQLLGRVTYDGFAKAWPDRIGDPFSDKFNSMPKYVVSSSLQKAEWNNSTILKNLDEVAKLKEQEGGDILIAGSGILVNNLLKAGLVDLIKLLVYPIVLGEGRKLFMEGTNVKLKLVESKPFATGVVAMHYEPLK